MPGTAEKKKALTDRLEALTEKRKRFVAAKDEAKVRQVDGKIDAVRQTMARVEAKASAPAKPAKKSAKK